MLLCFALIATGVTLRQIDRLWFGWGRPRTADAAELVALQRARVNNWSPALLLAGQWVQVLGYWLMAAQGAVPAALAVVGTAVQFRHLQEVSHFAIHGVLARTQRINMLYAEAFAQYPLGLVPATVRRKRHVRDHHPNATLDGSDPNLAELRQAGLMSGVSGRRFTTALLYPLTLRGLRGTLVELGANIRYSGRGGVRSAVVAGLLLGAYAAGGWSGVVCGVLLPRLLIYPQLSWLSLLVEHTWFDPKARTGAPAWVEAGRCLRLYPHNRLLAIFASATWLPYGDLHHYAHSTHPGVRWNYLPALERHLGAPHFQPTGIFLGPRSVTRRHQTALASTPAIPSPSGQAASLD